MNKISTGNIKRDDDMFCRVVPWFLLGVGFGRCSERRDVLGARGDVYKRQEFDVTRERIRQIEAKALRKLRHPSRSKKLKDYLE